MVHLLVRAVAYAQRSDGVCSVLRAPHNIVTGQMKARVTPYCPDIALPIRTSWLPCIEGADSICTCIAHHPSRTHGPRKSVTI